MSIDNRIDEKLKVKLGRLLQKIHILSRDDSLPVLLFLHGGPGITNRHSVVKHHADLLDTFTIVAWDQRGGGGSYWGAKKATLTVKQLTDDAAELVEWLCSRFKKDKLFIIGGSWGSELGTYLAHRYPAKIAAYVGFGQMVDGPENERISYEFALDSAKAAGDEKSVKILKDLGPPKAGIYKGGLKGLLIQRKVMMKYGGFSPNEKRRGIFESIVRPMLLSGEYSLSDIIGIFRGYKKVLNTMWPQIAAVNLASSCPDFKMPYIILNGRLDNNTPASLVDDYFKKIKAPAKELIWFENSGHNPMGDEGELFKSILRAKLSDIAKVEKAKGVKI